NPTRTTIDMRIEKSFPFGDYGKLSLYADIFNVGARRTMSINRNPDAELDYFADPPTYEHDPNYGRISSVYGVRYIRVGFRWSF
ncbi:unnamed protein product, partial [marine sediment metagenome]